MNKRPPATASLPPRPAARATRRGAGPTDRPTGLHYLALWGAMMLATGCAMGPVDNPLSGFLNRDARNVPTAGTAGQIARIEQQARKAKTAGAPAQAALAQQLRKQYEQASSPAVRLAIIRAWTHLQSAASLDGLAEALRSEDADLRIAACRALTKINTARSLEMLISAAGADNDTDVRQAALRGLGKFPQPKAIAALGQALDDGDPATQYVAVQALKRATGEDVGNDVRQWKQVATRHLQMATQTGSQEDSLAR